MHTQGSSSGELIPIDLQVEATARRQRVDGGEDKLGNIWPTNNNTSFTYEYGMRTQMGFSLEFLAKAFLLKFFSQRRLPSFKMTYLHFAKMNMSRSKYSLKRFKQLQSQCPHHGLPDWLLIQTFYNGMTQEFLIYVDLLLEVLSWPKQLILPRLC
ncbi:Extracellular metalloproteinase 5 [Bienertia sinuspersici]